MFFTRPNLKVSSDIIVEGTIVKPISYMVTSNTHLQIITQYLLLIDYRTVQIIELRHFKDLLVNWSIS